MTIIFALNKQDITFYLVIYKGVFHSSSAALHYQSPDCYIYSQQI